MSNLTRNGLVGVVTETLESLQVRLDAVSDSFANGDSGFNECSNHGGYVELSGLFFDEENFENFSTRLKSCVWCVVCVRRERVSGGRRAVWGGDGGVEFPKEP